MVRTIKGCGAYEQDLIEVSKEKNLQVQQILDTACYRIGRTSDEFLLGFIGKILGLRRYHTVAIATYRLEKDGEITLTVYDPSYLDTVQRIAERMEKKGYETVIVK